MNHQLRTRGEVPDIRNRTVGKGRATRKFVKLDGDAHTVKTADIGGQTVYWNDWINDMRSRKVKYIIFMIDDRHLDKHFDICLLYTSPSPRDVEESRMPSSA